MNMERGYLGDVSDERVYSEILGQIEPGSALLTTETVRPPRNNGVTSVSCTVRRCVSGTRGAGRCRRSGRSRYTGPCLSLPGMAVRGKEGHPHRGRRSLPDWAPAPGSRPSARGHGSVRDLEQGDFGGGIRPVPCMASSSNGSSSSGP